VTLAEAQGKKAAFLQEVVRCLVSRLTACGSCRVAENAIRMYYMRAVDRMDEAVETAARLVASGGWLALMTTQRDLTGCSSGRDLVFLQSPIPLPGGDERLLALGRLSVSSPV